MLLNKIEKKRDPVIDCSYYEFNHEKIVELGNFINHYKARKLLLKSCAINDDLFKILCKYLNTSTI